MLKCQPFVKMPTMVGILTFMRGKDSCSTELTVEHEIFFMTSDQSLQGNGVIFFQGLKSSKSNIAKNSYKQYKGE